MFDLLFTKVHFVTGTYIQFIVCPATGNQSPACMYLLTHISNSISDRYLLYNILNHYTFVIYRSIYTINMNRELRFYLFNLIKSNETKLITFRGTQTYDCSKKPYKNNNFVLPIFGEGSEYGH